MGKYPQNRFRRLVIVEPADNKPRQQSPAATLVAALALKLSRNKPGPPNNPGCPIAIQAYPHAGAIAWLMVGGVDPDVECSPQLFFRWK